MADRKRDEETGRYTDKYPPEEILTSIRNLGGMAATSEIADALDASRNTIYKKLRAMEANEQVSSRKAGGIRVWSAVNGKEKE